MLCQRNLTKVVGTFIKRREYIAIIGPRQSGKTTFLEILKTRLLEEFKIKKDLVQSVTFEDRKLLAQFEADPVAFVRSFRQNNDSDIFYFMIDEFQYAASGGQKLKLIYDTIKNIKIFITGSSSLDIKAQVGKYMVGRILTFYLYPFSFKEFLGARYSRLENIYAQRNIDIYNWLFNAKRMTVKSGQDIFYKDFNKVYEEFCIWGGYPAVVLSKNDFERRKVLSDIYNNYILKDIKTLLELATENNLYLLSQYLATQIGNIVVYQNLSQTAGLDYRNLKKHLNILRETFICQELKPFFKNRQKELSKNPKIFFNDLGFRNNLIESMNGLNMRSDAGAMVENVVFIRLYELCERIEKINFWRTKAGAEVDFVLHMKGEILPIEIKYSSFDTAKISKSMASFIDYFKPEYAAVLTKDYWGSLKKGSAEILFFPVYYL